MTFVGAVQAVRGVIWFALAAAAILPGRPRRPPDEGGRRRRRRVNRIISLAALAGLAVATLAFVARPASWFVSEVAGAAGTRPSARRRATRTSSVWATDGTADWLLWRIPDLRGRIAYDVRFELYDAPALDRIVDYGLRETGWRDLVRGYDVVIVDDPGHLRTLRRAPGTRVVYGDKTIFVLSRSA